MLVTAVMPHSTAVMPHSTAVMPHSAAVMPHSTAAMLLLLAAAQVVEVRGLLGARVKLGYELHESVSYAINTTGCCGSGGGDLEWVSRCGRGRRRCLRKQLI
jgi:hypothetical protein